MIAICLASTLFGSVLLTACSDTPQHVHDYVQSVTKEATCTEDGVKTFTCECGDTYTEPISALGHDYKVTGTIAANCTEPEKEQVKCERCNDETIRAKEGGQPALGHDWVTDATIPATCDDPEKVHQTCNRTDCDADRTVNKEGGQAALGHHYVADESTRTQPDCTHEGGVTMKCDREGCTDSYWHITPALGHTDDGTKNEVHQATCEDEGYTVHHCLVCDKDYKTDNIAPLGHDYQADGTVTASCDTIGYDKYTCTHGCGSVKRENVVQNTLHTFNEQGVCTGCGKTATEAMALIAKTTTPIEIVAIAGSTYEVYGMREKEHIIYIPYNVIEALVKQGVETIIISVGAVSPSDPISVVTKIDGVNALTANFGAGQIGEVAAIKIAQNGQIVSSINSDGIALSVFYHDNSLNRVNRYVVDLTYVHAFDEENVQTWYQTSLDVSGNASDSFHIFSGAKDSTYYKLYVRPELIKYYADQGADRLNFSFISKSGQRVIFAVDYAIGDMTETLPLANHVLTVPEIEITNNLLENGIRFRILFSDLSTDPNWASSNLQTADGFKLQTLLKKDFDENDASTYFESAANWTANNANNEFTFSNCDIGNNTDITIRPEYFAALAGKGYDKVVVTLSSKSGQNLTFSVVLDQNYMARGSVSFTLEITDELKTNGIKLPVYTSDNGSNGDGFAMRLDKVYAFDENNPVSFISAQGTDGVTYADGVWTFDKNVAKDYGYDQYFTVCAEAINKWAADGYGKLIIKLTPKSGETFATAPASPVFEVKIDDTVKADGYTNKVYIGPWDMNITGFNVSIELIEAFDANKPEKFITAEGTDGVSYENNVWTFDRTGTHYDQYFTVKAEAIQKWISDGYNKLIIDVKAKDGETLEQNPAFGIVSHWEINLADYVSSGFTDKSFIAKAAEEVTGFKIAIQLVVAFDENKSETFIAAPGTDGVTYADNVWTFAKNVNADYNQQIIIHKETIAKWIAEGYSQVTLNIVHKDGEILGTQGVQTEWTVTLAEYADQEYSLSPYIAPRNEEGGYGTITGFKVAITLS